MSVRVPFRPVLLAIAALVVAGVVAFSFVFHPNLTPVERGRRVAEANGCFGCHGPEGTHGTANPGRTDGSVPSYSGSLMMYASNAEEVREWIEDGMTKKKAASESWKEDRRKGTLRMPAYGRRLSDSEIDDLVAFVLAAAGEPAPEDSLPLAGRDRAEALGCVGCHGTGGRFARPNPGSFKGYVPPWDGADFTDLVRDKAEFREWVEEGMGKRFRSNPMALFFLRRAALHMPAYRAHLAPGDVEALWAYVSWLRSPQAATVLPR
ncbi:MAG TPA: c-type cytochrome [Candidatus Eisenbacteria bacterium]